MQEATRETGTEKTYDLSHVHRASLKILKEIDRICRKYKIQYALDAGTLIGAARHQGFIPWDDDADVVFTRNHFEAFLRVARRELPAGMTLVMPDEYHDGKAFYDFTPRIIYENSQMRKDSEEMRYYDGKLNHIWVDLFILDKLPAKKTQIQMVKFLQKVLYGFAMGHRYQLNYQKYKGKDKIFVGTLATIGKCLPLRWIFRLQRRLSLCCRRHKATQYYYSNYQPDYLYVTLEKDWCVHVTDMDFEDTKLMVPVGWEQVLEMVYGDYRKLPPKEKRVPSHSNTEILVFDDEGETK
ncbi:MAG: LicD family protein [bacterium]|nr:LicD family protein [bacterium]